MPAQALIRHLSKQQLNTAAAPYAELLEIKSRPDGSHLVTCKSEDGRTSAPGAAAALQVIADLDAAEVRKKEAAEKAKADAAAKKG